MLAEIQELQNDAVSQLIATLKSTPKDSYTFRAPTGSGKTYMMADFMNRMIEINPDIVFLVSVICMKDSRRAGIPDKDKTTLVTTGIYKNTAAVPRFSGLILCISACFLCI